MKYPLLAAATLTLLALQPISLVRAENAMGYRPISDAEAASLPRNHGALGLDVGGGRQIRDRDIDFELIRVTQVRRGSPGANAGIQPGDQIIAVNGRVFGSLAAFGAYVGSMRPGSRAVVDLIPAGRGPADAERITLTAGETGRPQKQQAHSEGMSTRMKLGLAAAGLFVCYEIGCFSGTSGSSGQTSGTPAR